MEAERAAAAAQAESLGATLERERLKLSASVQAERLALQAQAQEVIDSQRRFEVLQRTYQVRPRRRGSGGACLARQGSQYSIWLAALVLQQYHRHLRGCGKPPLLGATRTE